MELYGAALKRSCAAAVAVLKLCGPVAERSCVEAAAKRSCAETKLSRTGCGGDWNAAPQRLLAIPENAVSKTPDVCESIDRLFYEHLSGDWDSLQRWAWVYLHGCIMLATVLIGYAVARGELAIAALLLPFPVFYLYRRYTYARPRS
ncbi:hypothetical protein [Salinarchaeum chitinilyticum]